VRFAVRRPGIPEASPRSHGVPRRDIPSCIHVSVADETAGRTREVRLVLARLPVHVPARRAPLTCVRGLDPFHPAGRLVLQPTHEQTPSGLQDLAVKPRLLADISARGLGGPLGRPGHAANLQVFDADHIEPAGQICTGLLRPILASVGLAGTQSANRMLHTMATVRIPLGTGELALQPPQPHSLPRSQAGRVQQFTRRQRCADHNTAVYADNLAGAQRGDRTGYGGEGDMPSPGTIQCHPVGLHPRRHCAGPTEPHPPGLRYPHLADFAAQ